MPPKFDPIMTTIEETQDLSTLLVTELVGSLEAYGIILHIHKEDTLENSFQSKLKFQPQNNENGGKKSYGDTSRRREVSRNFLKNKSYKNPPYNICKRLGYAEKNCWYRNMPQCNHCEKFKHVVKICPTKISIKLISQRSMIKKNACYIPLKTQSNKKEEVGIWIVDATITWPRMR